MNSDEIYLERLLSRCEGMAKNLQQNDEWRLKKYIEHLDYLLSRVKERNESNVDDVKSYTQRIAFLESVLNIHKEDSPLEKEMVLQNTPKGMSVDDSKELHHFTSEAVSSKVREELLGTNSSNLRHRKTFVSNYIPENENTGELDVLLKHHHSMQEKIADDMLALARNIKEQSLLAGTIIRNDSQVVENSSVLADRNIDELKVHSDKLQENTKRTWQCWVWVLVIVVVVVFVNMVLLMKVMKKRT